MGTLYNIFIDPFVMMGSAPDLLIQTLWEGFVAGVLYALIALGFVLIFKASGVFNFAQGIMVVFAALTLVGFHEMGVPALVALILSIGVMFVLALTVERVVLRPLVNQPDIILFMATFGLTYFLIGFGELIFGGSPKQMIAQELYLPQGATDLDLMGGLVRFQHIDIAAAVIASLMIAILGVFFSKTRIGRALRAVADSHKAALSVGISLGQIWVIVWFAAGIVALVAGIMWGARSDVSFALQIVALKALAGADPWRSHIDPGRHCGRFDHRRQREARRILLGRGWSAAASRPGSLTSSRCSSCSTGPKACSAIASSSGFEEPSCFTARRASSRRVMKPTWRSSRCGRIASASP